MTRYRWLPYLCAVLMLVAILWPAIVRADDVTAAPTATPPAVVVSPQAAPEVSPVSGAAPSFADDCMNCGGTRSSLDVGVASEFVSGEWKAGASARLYYEAGVGFGDQTGVTLGRMFAEGTLGLRNGDVIGDEDGSGESITPASIRIAAGYKFIFSRRTYAAPPPDPDDKSPDMRPRTVLMSVYGRMGGEFSPTSEDINPAFARQMDAGIGVEARRGDETVFDVKAGVGTDETLNPPGSIPLGIRTLVGTVEGSVPIVRKDKLSGKIRARLTQQLLNQDVLQRGARVTISIAGGWDW